MSIFRSQIEIQSRLKELFADGIARFPQFKVYVPSAASPDEASLMLQRIEKEFSVALPASFVDGAMKWDLGRLVLCNFHFGTGGDYLADLKKFNTATPGCEWWGDREDYECRPANLLAIAQSDPFLILLNTETGNIYGHVVDDGSANTKQVAPTLDLFLRAVGSSLFYSDTQQARDEYMQALLSEFCLVDAASFWREFIETR